MPAPCSPRIPSRIECAAARLDSTCSASARSASLSAASRCSSAANDTSARARIPVASVSSLRASRRSGAKAGCVERASVACSSAVRRPSIAAVFKYQCSTAAKNGGGSPALPRCRKIGRPGRLRRRACGNPIVVAAKVFDRVVPAGALVVDHRLDEGERAGLEVRAMIFERPEERRHLREPLLGQIAADLVFRVVSGFDAAKHLQRVPTTGKCQALASIAGISCPGRAGRRDPGCSRRPSRPARALSRS